MKNSNIAKTVGGLVLIVNTANADRVGDFVDDLADILTGKGHTVAINDTLQPGGTYTEDPETTTVKIETGDNAVKEIRGTEIDAGAAITANKMFIGKDKDTSYVKIIFADAEYNSATASAIEALNTNPKRLYAYVAGSQLDSADQIALKYFKIEPPVGVKYGGLDRFINPEPRKRGNQREYISDLLGKRIGNQGYRPGLHIKNGKPHLQHRPLYRR